MPTNEHIFELIQSLSKRERHHLRLMVHHFGKKETMFYRLLDELYRMREFDQDHLMNRLGCKSYIVRRGMTRLFQLSLEARALIAPTDREKLLRSIEDIRYLIHKKAKASALPLIRETLESCQVHELFDEQLELLGIWNRHYQPNVKDQKTIAAATQEAKSAKANLQAYEALQRRMEHINRREVEKRFDMLTEGILRNPLMLSNERCESSRARFIFHTILGKLNTYLGNYEVAVEHLRRTNFMVASYKHLFRDHEFMLLRGQSILARMFLAMDRIIEADEILRQIWGIEFEEDYLISIKFKEYCSIKLRYSLDSGNTTAGYSSINLLEKYLDDYADDLDIHSKKELLFIAALFLFFDGKSNRAETYFKRVAFVEFDQHRPDPRKVDFSSFALLMLLVLAIDIKDEDSTESIRREIRKRLRYKQFEPSYLAKGLLSILDNAIQRLETDTNSFWRDIKIQIDELPHVDIDRLGLKFYIKAKQANTFPMDIVRNEYQEKRRSTGS